MLSENHNAPLLVGLTGGIGSGKSTVAKIFAVLDVPVFSADEAGRNAYADEGIVAKVKELLGQDILNKQGKPDKSKIADLVFNDQEKLKNLNGIIHPFVRSRFQAWLQQYSGALYVIRESAILFEAGIAKEHDLIIHVSAPEDLRIRRVMKRDLCKYDEVKSRMARQMNEPEREAQCDFVIHNTETRAILPQVLHIHHILKNESSKFLRNKKRR